jgi:hypothetical protein
MGVKKKILTKADTLLKSLYYNPAAPGSFSGVNSLLEAAVKKLKGNKRIKITKEGVQKFLSGEETFTLHKLPRKNFPRRRVVVSGPMEQFQSDLVDMSMFENENSGFRWILMTLDVFTKKAYAIPVKRKDSKHMVLAFKELFKQTQPPYKLQTDKVMYLYIATL